MLSSITTSLNFGHSMELSEGCSDKGSIERDTNSMMSRYSGDGGSTASLVSCPEWKHFKTNGGRSSSDHSRMSLDSSDKNAKTTTGGLMHPSSYSDTSQESLPSDNIGGEITYHRYYHVFREGELDQLIEKYVENLHIISSYYDHASWCIIAEKVQVWTIWPPDGTTMERTLKNDYAGPRYEQLQKCRKAQFTIVHIIHVYTSYTILWYTTLWEEGDGLMISSYFFLYGIVENAAAFLSLMASSIIISERIWVIAETWICHFSFLPTLTDPPLNSFINTQYDC